MIKRELKNQLLAYKKVQLIHVMFSNPHFQRLAPRTHIRWKRKQNIHTMKVAREFDKTAFLRRNKDQDYFLNQLAIFVLESPYMKVIRPSKIQQRMQPSLKDR